MRRLHWILLPLYGAFSQGPPAASQPAPAASQSTPHAAFEVATVKPSPPSPGDAIYINLGAARHGMVTMANVTLSECIRWAYNLVSEEQVTGPAWINERATRFDITAKASSDTPGAQLRMMMQTLLAERFGLKLHSEPKRLEHLDLSVSKTGAKVAKAVGDAPAFPFEYGRGRLAYSQITMHTLAVLLARQLKQIVLDNTGLPGYYDVKLEWTPDDADVAGVDIYSAVRQQLGLNLERSKAPVDVLIVDHAEKTPSEN